MIDITEPVSDRIWISSNIIFKFLISGTLNDKKQKSRMSKEKLMNDGFSMLPDWKDAVDRYNKELIKVRKKDD